MCIYFAVFTITSRINPCIKATDYPKNSSSRHSLLVARCWERGNRPGFVNSPCPSLGYAATKQGIQPWPGSTIHVKEVCSQACRDSFGVFLQKKRSRWVQFLSKSSKDREINLSMYEVEPSIIQNCPRLHKSRSTDRNRLRMLSPKLLRLSSMVQHMRHEQWRLSRFQIGSE